MIDEPMPARRALALALMAVLDVAEGAPDVRDWQLAAVTLRAMLAELQEPAPAWEWYSPGGKGQRSRGRRNGNGRDPGGM